MLKLNDGDSGQLITPLTTQTLAYMGAANESISAPIYSAYSPNRNIADGDNLTKAIAKLDAAVYSGLPVGLMFPFYDFGGAATFDNTIFAYMIGQTISVGTLGPQFIPDMSGRYAVGFGTEGGANNGLGVLPGTQVGNPSNVANLQHAHSLGNHTHGAGTLEFQVMEWDNPIAGGNAGMFAYLIAGTPQEIGELFQSTGVGGGDTWKYPGGSPAIGTKFFTKNGFGVTAPSAGTTDNQLSTTQLIQPSSIQVRWLIKIN